MSTLASALSRIVRSRAFQFFAVGAVLAALAPRQVDERSIVIDGPRVFDALRAEEARRGRALTPSEQSIALQETVDEAVLAREASRIGLGLDDAVVRARLAEQMRSSLSRSMPPPSIDDAELDAAVAKEIAAAPERVRLAVWFVSRDRVDAASAADALARSVAADRERARGLGDRPPIPDGAFWTKDALERVCGPGAAHAAMSAKVGEATAATASAWGHYVFVPLERRRATPEEVRGAARDALVAKKSEADLAKAIARARRDYRIEVRAPAGIAAPALGSEPAQEGRGVN